MVLDTLLRHLQKDELIISSFDVELLQRLKRRQAGVAVGLILGGDSKVDSLIAATREVEPDFLSRLTEVGKGRLILFLNQDGINGSGR